jgi:hypothetical protein
MRLALMPAFDVACALLVIAGIGKVKVPIGTRDALRRTGLPVRPVMVRVIGGLEAALGTFAATRPGAVSAAAIAVAYATSGALVLVLLLVAGGPADCGCFAGSETRAGPTHLGLNGVACCVGVLAALSPPPGLAWIFGRPALLAVPLAVGTVGAAAAVYVMYTAFEPAWRAYRTRASS